MESLLDVSELEAPDPLLRAIAALETLAEGDFLRFQHRMKPCHLYDAMAENGFDSLTCKGKTVACEVLIWRSGDGIAEDDARRVAEALQPWVEE